MVRRIGWSSVGQTTRWPYSASSLARWTSALRARANRCEYTSSVTLAFSWPSCSATYVASWLCAMRMLAKVCRNVWKGHAVDARTCCAFSSPRWARFRGFIGFPSSDAIT
jgi:hypothetical protein